MVELTSLWMPILLSTVALFFLSFLTWTVLPIHKGRSHFRMALADSVANLQKSLLSSKITTS